MKKTLLKLAVALCASLMFTASAYAINQTVTGTVNFLSSFSETISAGLPAPLSATEGVNQVTSYTAAGTGSGQVDTLYAAQITLVASTPQTFDLTNLQDPLGKTATFARVREFIVQNTTTTAGYDCKVYAGSSNGWSVLPASTSPLYARYGSVLYLQDRNSTGSNLGNVVSSTSKTVTLDPGTNGPMVVNFIVAGGSAQ